MLCDPQRLLEQVHTPEGASLLPKLRDHFAEFLDQSSLKRLGAFTPAHPSRFAVRFARAKLRGFSWQPGISHFSLAARTRVSAKSGGFAYRMRLHACTGVQQPADLPFCVPSSHTRTSTGILTRFPSATRFRLALGTDLPWEDYLYPGNLGLTANEFLTRFIVTHVRIITSLPSSIPFGMSSSSRERSPTDPCGSRSFGAMLSPVTFSAQSR